VRFDHFLPFLSKKKAREGEPPGRLRRVLHALVPRALRSTPREARAGPLRQLLGRAGPTWVSAPVRRVLQMLFLAAFLVLFFWVAWPYGAREYALHRESKELIDAELFLALDPLVSVSTALAARTWVWSLAFAAVMLLSGVLVPRGFCGYVCPLGTLIDLFDWAVGRRVQRFRVERDGWWTNLKYYLLTGTLIAAACGVLLSGFVAAIPVLTRGLQFSLAPLQSGIARDWYLVPPMNVGHVVSLVLFAAVLAMGLWRPRFWCRYVCPTGAMFSVANAFRGVERKVESSCINCNKCALICPFDAIKADYTTRTADCTLCQTCGGVCPTHSIKFVHRLERSNLKTPGDPPVHETAVSRRGLLVGSGVGVLGALLTRYAFGVPRGDDAEWHPIRPPGSVPEEDFLDLCIRCGECFRACPNDVLQPMAFEQGFEGLWAPQAVPNWAGCEPSCNNCGQVCPTGAIRALPLEEKRAARMGLAIIDPQTCLPLAGREDCQMCVDECAAADYHAIEFMRVHPRLDDDGAPVPGTGFLAPVVIDDLCVGCGLCQTRCHGINVKEKGLLRRTAIEVFAGPGRDDRLRSGSYIALHVGHESNREDAADEADDEDYLPDFLK